MGINSPWNPGSRPFAGSAFINVVASVSREVRAVVRWSNPCAACASLMRLLSLLTFAPDRGPQASLRLLTRGSSRFYPLTRVPDHTTFLRCPRVADHTIRGRVRGGGV